MTNSWLERLTDRYVDLNLPSLIILLLAIVVAVVASHIYFRWRLEPAVTDGTSPRTVRLESFALALAVGALIAAFSGWGFLWVAGILLIALILALMAGARKLLALIICIILLAVVVTIAGLKLTDF